VYELDLYSVYNIYVGEILLQLKHQIAAA